jgi:hypothetical protein
MKGTTASVKKKKITILNPRATLPPIKLVPMAPRLDKLDGKTIYIVDVGFQLTEPFYDAALKLLKEKYPKTKWIVKQKFGSFFHDDPKLWAEIKQKADGAIVGPGHMDTLGPSTVNWCTSLEKLGVPTVPLLCAVFPQLERGVAFLRGIPKMRITNILFEVIGTSEEHNRKLMEGNDPVTGKPVLKEIVEGLTKPLTAEEKKTGTIKRPVPRLLEPDTPENLQRLINEKGWTDYYPVVLPTEEKVAEMLKGTSHKPDEIVGKMPVTGPYESLEYTVEKVAANAVMAGVRPEYFPVVLAIASTGETSLWSSVTSQTRMVVVNGPVRNEIKMNSGIGALGPFNEANAVIGRSWTFISKNLGGIGGVPKVNYLGVFGNSSNYNNLCFAENEEGLPKGWKPLHVQKGFKAKESTVSLFAGMCMLGPTSTSIEAAAFHERIKAMLAQNFKPSNVFYRGVSFGLRATVLVTPQAASDMVNEGFKSKEELNQWLLENTWKSKGRGKSNQPSPDSHLEIVVVGDVSGTCQLGNLHYTTTASIDKWR